MKWLQFLDIAIHGFAAPNSKVALLYFTLKKRFCAFVKKLNEIQNLYFTTNKIKYTSEFTRSEFDFINHRKSLNLCSLCNPLLFVVQIAYPRTKNDRFEAEKSPLSRVGAQCDNRTRAPYNHGSQHTRRNFGSNARSLRTNPQSIENEGRFKP